MKILCRLTPLAIGLVVSGCPIRTPGESCRGHDDCSGAEQCHDGTCTPPPRGECAPRGETCNGLDDDCDGITDNHLSDVGDTCDEGVGRCSIAGAMHCVAGELRCDAEPGEPVAETCNGIDDDCDGTADNHLTDDGGVCDKDVGGCSTAGTVQCIAGELRCDAEPSQPVAETCNGLDDDCDGTADNSPTDDGGACREGIGRCSAAGTMRCATGELVCDAEPGEPVAEICNGLDDDCDGIADNDPAEVGGICSEGVGRCSATGTMQCVAGDLVCDAEPGEPVAEICNGLDDDCDGTADNDPAEVGGICSEGVGRCSATGTMQCVAGDLVCDAEPGEPVAEICNGLDDDCDGRVDELEDLDFALQGECADDAADLIMCEPACEFVDDEVIIHTSELGTEVFASVIAVPRGFVVAWPEKVRCPNGVVECSVVRVALLDPSGQPVIVDGDFVKAELRVGLETRNSWPTLAANDETLLVSWLTTGGPQRRSDCDAPDPGPRSATRHAVSFLRLADLSSVEAPVVIDQWLGNNVGGDAAWSQHPDGSGAFGLFFNSGCGNDTLVGVVFDDADEDGTWRERTRDVLPASAAGSGEVGVVALDDEVHGWLVAYASAFSGTVFAAPMRRDGLFDEPDCFAQSQIAGQQTGHLDLARDGEQFSVTNRSGNRIATATRTRPFDGCVACVYGFLDRGDGCERFGLGCVTANVSAGGGTGFADAWHERLPGQHQTVLIAFLESAGRRRGANVLVSDPGRESSHPSVAARRLDDDRIRYMVVYTGQRNELHGAAVIGRALDCSMP